MHWKDATDNLLHGLIEAPRLGVICDFDGTLSPIVAHPGDARPTERNAKVLQALRDEVALLAFISGRAADDLRGRLDLDGVAYIGNHGMETWRDGLLQVHPEVAAYRPALEQIADSTRDRAIPGLMVEDKRVTLSIHYRNTENPEQIAAELGPALDALSQQHGLKMFSGRMVFEIRPPVEINKGTAFRRLIEQFRLDAAIYLGDDTTDADAMQVAQQMRAEGSCYSLALGVEADETPAIVLASSDVLAAGIDDVSAFLEWLLRSLKASSS